MTATTLHFDQAQLDALLHPDRLTRPGRLP